MAIAFARRYVSRICLCIQGDSECSGSLRPASVCSSSSTTYLWNGHSYFQYEEDEELAHEDETDRVHQLPLRE